MPKAIESAAFASARAIIKREHAIFRNMLKTYKPEPGPSHADRQALVMFSDHADDGAHIDLNRPEMKRLAEIGWIYKIKPGIWQMSDAGMAVLEEIEAAGLGSA